MISELEAKYVPSLCPECSSELEWTQTKVDLICFNPMCPAKLLNRIEHFCRCMGIEEMSVVTLEKLNLTCIEDLYKLEKEYIATLDGFGDRKADIIIEQIEKSLIDVMPAKFIEAFGIPGVGEKIAEAVYRLLPGDGPAHKIRNFFDITYDELCFVDGVGSKIAENVLSTLPKLKDLYSFLELRGLRFKVTSQVSNKLDGVKIAMTGSSPDGRKRQELERILRDHGAIVGSVSSKTEILIAEDANGNSSKLKNARKYGTKIVSYDEFFKDM